ncbi:hypothetical protein LNV09_22550 [Paucibacter sp. B2R-40]|uniref:DUF6080 domain-containing protein n=1 Tax=Paucibacter sp. B2R-40 TaxID=2893554 RepID=UPI0021E384AA|nr:DUF6080 domain-containing protein [Paucibacter sp. B2R-40]MCV2356932.1 hypothetical protein [Paucibacter sp. B2R-40]
MISIAAAVAFFILTFAITSHWERRDVFAQHDVLFDTDTKSRLDCYANGWAGHGRNTVHPNLCNFVNPPIRALASLLGSTEGRLSQRELLALFVSPLAGALTLLIVMLTLVRSTVGPEQVLLLGVVLAASFSQLLFSSLPDHFALGGLTLALALYLFVDRLEGGPPRRWAWLFAAWLTAGVTFTNLFPVLGLHLLACWRIRGAGLALRDTVVLAGLAFGATFASAMLLNLGYGLRGYEMFLASGAGPLKSDPLAALLSFPVRILQSFAPTDYELIFNQLSLREPHHYDIQFDLSRNILPSLVGWLLGASMAMCVAMRWRQGGVQRWILLGLVGVVLFNGLLHARIGTDYFLYSSHWMGAAVLVLALPDNVWPPLVRRLHIGLLSLIGIAMAYNSATLLLKVDADLQRNWHSLTGLPASSPVEQQPSL